MENLVGKRFGKLVVIKQDLSMHKNSLNKGTIKFNTSELRNLSRDATGVKAITLNDGDYVVDLIRG